LDYMQTILILVLFLLSLSISTGCDNNQGYSGTRQVILPAGKTSTSMPERIKPADTRFLQETEDQVLTSYKYEFSENHPSNSKSIYVLSLRNLINRYSNSINSKKETVRLSKLGWIEGYVIDRENNDILFFGRVGSDWPDLYIDDLLLLSKIVIDREKSPFCSLDPIPENVREFERVSSNKDESETLVNYYNRVSRKWGDQKVVVGGVPGNSNIARVMLEADYHMKRISQGLDSLPFIESLLDIYIDKAMKSGRDRESKPIMSRFWFKCDPNSPVFEYEDDIVRIDACNVIIQTEAQGATRDGRLYDSGDRNVESDKFAESFSRNFRKAAAQVSIYAELENLYRLLSLLKAVTLEDSHFQDFTSLYNEMGQTFNYYRTYNIPSAFPGLTNARIIRDTNTGDSRIAEKQYLYMVCGGVEMDMPVAYNRRRRGGSSLAELRDDILDSRVDDAEGWLVETKNLPAGPQSFSTPYTFREIEMPQEHTLIKK